MTREMTEWPSECGPIAKIMQSDGCKGYSSLCGGTVVRFSRIWMSSGGSGAGLKGPLMKVAQIMATIPDALPDEYVEELKQLQTNAPSMGWPFVRRRMASELGSDWRGRFAKARVGS